MTLFFFTGVHKLLLVASLLPSARATAGGGVGVVQAQQVLTAGGVGVVVIGLCLCDGLL